MRKKLLLIISLICLIALSNTVNAQNTDIKKIVGYWVSDSTTAKLVFFFDKDHNLQLVQWDSDNGEETDIVKLEMKDDFIETTERMKSTNHVTYNIYKLQDENTIVNIIRGDSKTTINFKRLK